LASSEKDYPGMQVKKRKIRNVCFENYVKFTNMFCEKFQSLYFSAI